MRKTAIVAIAATTFILSITAFGQSNNMGMDDMMQNTDNQGMMGPMMMQGQQGMMDNQSGMMGNGMGMMPMMRMMSMMQGNHGMMSGMMGSKSPSVFSILRQQNRLNLTRDQLDRLQEQALQLRKQAIRYRADLAQSGLDVQTAFQNADPNREQVEQLVTQQSETYANWQQTLVSSYFTGLEILTDEQRETVRPLTGVCPMMQGTMTGMSPQGMK